MIDMRKSALADAVLAYMRWSALEDGPTIIVTPYQNGQESGWVASIWGEGKGDQRRTAAFSEDRHSDLIVLYIGHSLDFDINGTPEEDVYNGKTLFKTEEAFAVASAATDWLYDAKRHEA